MTEPSAAEREMHSIVMVGYKDAQILDIAGPLEMFAAVNILQDRAGREGPPAYNITLLAREAGPFPTTGGLDLVAHGSFSEFEGPIDTFMVSGGDGTLEALKDQALLDFIADHAPAAQRVVSICSGAFLLAEVGLLKGKRATTHWAAAEYLRKLYPDVKVEEDAIYVQDGTVWTSAGVTSGMDLALRLIADDHGTDLALEVARKNVMFMVRPGGQSQFSSHLAAASAKDRAIRKVLDYIIGHLSEDLTVPRLSDVAVLSERTFLRRFKEETGTTPAKFVESARLESARHRLEATPDTIEGISLDCGFGSVERMRRVFQRHLGIAPGQYRERFQLRA